MRGSAAAGCGHPARRAPAPALSMVLSSTSTSAHLAGGFFFGKGVKKNNLKINQWLKNATVVTVVLQNHFLL